MGSAVSLSKRKSILMRFRGPRRNHASMATASNGDHLSTTSSTSTNSTQLYQHIGGRRYHNEAGSVYCLPADDEEIDRLQLQHYALNLLWESAYSAPVEVMLKTNNLHVLDVGCGPGIWTLEMATVFPNSQFVGIDISEVFPMTIKPQNTQFIRMNFLDGLPFGDESFDYIFQRLLVLAYTPEQWEHNVIPELLRLTKKGGWIELAETDLAWRDGGPKFRRWIESLTSYTESNGIDGRIVLRLTDLFRQTGEVCQVHTYNRDMPFGSWGGRAGKWAADSVYNLIMGMKPHVHNSMDLTPEEFDAYALELRAETEHYKAYASCYRICIQKA